MGNCKTKPEYLGNSVQTKLDRIRYSNRCIPKREDALKWSEIYSDTGMFIVQDPLHCQQDFYDKSGKDEDDRVTDPKSELYCNRKLITVNNGTLSNSIGEFREDNNEYLEECVISENFKEVSKSNRSDSCRGTRIIPFLFTNRIDVYTRATGVGGGVGQITRDKIKKFREKYKDNLDGICKLISDEWEADTRPDFMGKRDAAVVELLDYGPTYYHTVDGENPAEGGEAACWGLFDKDVSSVNANSIRCVRREYHGDPLACCLKNWDKNNGSWGRNNDKINNNDVISYEEDCFEPFADRSGNPDRKKTCDPKYSSPTSKSCKEKLFNYCIGTDLPGEKYWIRDRWIYKNKYQSSDISACDYFMGRLLSTNQIENNSVAAGIIAAMINKLELNTDNILTIANSVDSILWKNFENICSSKPGLCDDALYRYCTKYTREQVIKSENLRNICGCFLPTEEYNVGDYSIQRECSPLCVSAKIRTGNIGTGTYTPCAQSTCIINDLAINIINSKGNIDINQYCGNCASSSSRCTCIIDNTDISQIGSIGNIIVNQSCASKQCVEKDSDGNIKQVQCPEDAAANPINQVNSKTWRNIMFILGALIGIVIILVFLILFFK